MKGPANPSAFPYTTATLQQDPGVIERQNVPGMSLRDYFAAAAVTGLIANGHQSKAATMAFNIADAMLAEREKAAKS